MHFALDKLMWTLSLREFLMHLAMWPNKAVMKAFQFSENYISSLLLLQSFLFPKHYFASLTDIAMLWHYCSVKSLGI